MLSSIVSGEGIDNLSGEAGTGPSVGSAIQLIGVTIALIAGVLAVRQAYRSDAGRGQADDT